MVEKDCLEKTEAEKFELSVDVTDYDYLVFYGQKIKEQGQLTVCIFDQAGTKVDEFSKAYNDIDDEKHQYLIDVSSISGNVRIVFSGGYIDDTENIDSEFIIHDITLY